MAPAYWRRADFTRSLLRLAIEQRLISTGLQPPEPFGTPEEAAHAVVAAYDGVTVQRLVDNDLAADRAWLLQLLTALLPGHQQLYSIATQ